MRSPAGLAASFAAALPRRRNSRSRWRGVRFFSASSSSVTKSPRPASEVEPVAQLDAERFARIEEALSRVAAQRVQVADPLVDQEKIRARTERPVEKNVGLEVVLPVPLHQRVRRKG